MNKERTFCKTCFENATGKTTKAKYKNLWEKRNTGLNKV
jgi:hypothetical protein